MPRLRAVEAVIDDLRIYARTFSTADNVLRRHDRPATVEETEELKAVLKRYEQLVILAVRMGSRR